MTIALEDVTRPPPEGFAEPVHDAARTFRTLLCALSRPGSVLPIPALPSAPQAASAAMTACLLTLCDADTPVALLGRTANCEVGRFIAFHTGAPSCEDPAQAAFVFADPLDDPALLDRLATGTQAYPDRSATLIAEVTALEPGTGARLEGPGIDGHARLGCPLFTDAFAKRWSANNAGFPRGVDLVLTCRDRLAALPRTARITVVAGA